MAVKMSRKRSGLVIYSYLKDNAVTAVKTNVKFRKVLNEICSKVDERKNGRLDDMKRTQPRSNRRKGLTTRRKASGAPKTKIR